MRFRLLGTALAIAFALVVTSSSAFGIRDLTSSHNRHKTCAVIDVHDFPDPTRIDNPFSPFVPGATFVYEGLADDLPQEDIVSVTDHTKVILGLTAVVVRDAVTEQGQLTELTFDYHAQDRFGNVWYLGEDATQYENGAVVGHEGSWLAGVDGAQPGIVMLGEPEVGDFYCQENAPGAAQDQAKVVGVDESVCVPYVCVDEHVLVTKENSPLEKGTVEEKSFVRGLGNVKAIDVKGGQDEVELVSIR